MNPQLALLRPAVAYALDAVDTVTPDLLSQPTPCAKWNLRSLLNHTSASAAALHEGLAYGRVGLFPDDKEDDDHDATDPAGLARVRVRRLLEEWFAADDDRAIMVADHRIPLSLLAGAAALEIAVHGWDVRQASRQYRPIPGELAADLLALAHQLVSDDNRHHLFAPPLPISATAGPSEKLLAFLGRSSVVVPSITRKAS